MKLYVLLLISLVFSQETIANTEFAQTTIKRVVVHDFGKSILVITKDNINGGEGCTNNTSVTLLKTHPLFNEMYSAILSAFHTGTIISGWINGCDPMFKNPILTRLDLIK
ncbi:TPA: hypothetical protein RQN03_003307 [Aeromonas dhakensis]|uniref:hypothetical protein n=1 Tax=Aeromonas dhakensis TaxID=196024 RepID=UPI00227D22B1|nr:hypothetical protein [Aeromonas dhakensis]WAF68961.1 hypothetical protein NRK98_02615 [Aeromonas dhakensis]HDX8342538.1 hypothetical protein [Aeromonas dhakensis]